MPYGDLAPDWLEGAQAQPATSWNADIGMPTVPPPIVPPRPNVEPDISQMSPQRRMLEPRFWAEQAIPHMLSAPFELAGGPQRAWRGEMSPEEMYNWGPGMALGMLAPAPRPFGLGIGPTRLPRAGEAYGARSGQEIPGALAPAERGGGGIGSLEEAQRAAAQAAGSTQAIEGLPTKPLKIGEQYYVPGPNELIRNVAEDYMRSTGRPYFPAKTYAEVDVPRAERIAQAFEDMPHAPDDPAVRASYNAMINETIDQFRAIERNHPNLKIEFIKPGMKDPYHDSPRLANKDLRDNNHLWVFPTDLGFGTGPEAAAFARENPMLQATGITVDGRPTVANDIFRIVHDYFGHFKEGHGFRAAGEENAWRSHAAMYSDLARPAMTTETRGQNSWLNYGPHGEKNRTAKSEDTTFADQKIGLLPDWVVNEGRGEPAPYSQYTYEYPPSAPGVPKPKETGGVYMGKQLSEEAEAFAKQRSKIIEQMREGYTPYFDPAKRSYVDPANYPPANVDTLSIQPQREATMKEYKKWIDAPETMKQLEAAYKRGDKLGNADDWYAMAQFEKEYIKEYGEKEGRRRFLDEFAFPMAATTAGQAPPANFLMAQYLEYNRRQGKEVPAAVHELPVTVSGGPFGKTNLKNYALYRERGGYQALGADQPKMHNFARSMIGDLSRAVIDEQMASGMLAHAPKGVQAGARDVAYGLLEEPVHRAALRRGMQPGNVQDVAWAGFKGGSAGPMIDVINDAIERTHRLTGMPRDLIVKYGLIRKEIPIYSAPALPMPYGLSPEGGSSNRNDRGRPAR